MSSPPLVIAPAPTKSPPPPGPPSPAELLLPPPLPENVTKPTAVAPPLERISPPTANSTTFMALGVGIGIGGIIVLVCVGIFVFWCTRRKGKRLGTEEFGYAPPKPLKGDLYALPSNINVVKIPNLTPLVILPNTHHSAMGVSTSPPSITSSLVPETDPHATLDPTKTTFTYEELAFATDNFSTTNLLGQGGFGYVHKGVLHDGRDVAIKQLKVGSGQGEREFQAEVEMISRVHHSHLVSLFGYCISGTRRLLVYEYVPNQTLEFHLHGKGKPLMNWATRMKVALGSAKGLAYLHEECHPKIIHRDIKSANILLDENFVTKVADFGLARFYSDTDTHVSTRVMGTFGYLAPEYALTGKLTNKSDVFSFGVVLLELITGRRPIDRSQNYLDDNIIDWARPLLSQALENNNFDHVADPRLLKDYDCTEMARMVACASGCIRHLARRRPKINQIIRALEGKLPLHELEGILSNTRNCSNESSDYDAAQYKEDLIKFKKMALETSGFSRRPSGDEGFSH